MEKPIIFSGEMVRAILAGRKTQTRRVIKPQPTIYKWEEAPNGEPWMPVGGVRQDHWVCPYGKVGDRLWVRESFSETKKRNRDVTDRIELVHHAWRYKADEEMRSTVGVFICGQTAKTAKTMADLYKWTSPLFMTREASRITLEITNIRVERLQEISFSDVNAEGMDTRDRFITWKNPFADAWDKINGKKHSWASNPFCWVIEFIKV